MKAKLTGMFKRKPKEEKPEPEEPYIKILPMTDEAMEQILNSDTQFYQDGLEEKRQALGPALEDLKAILSATAIRIAVKMRYGKSAFEEGESFSAELRKTFSKLGGEYARFADPGKRIWLNDQERMLFSDLLGLNGVVMYGDVNHSYVVLKVNARKSTITVLDPFGGIKEKKFVFDPKELHTKMRGERDASGKKQISDLRPVIASGSEQLTLSVDIMQEYIRKEHDKPGLDPLEFLERRGYSLPLVNLGRLGEVGNCIPLSILAAATLKYMAREQK